MSSLDQADGLRACQILLLWGGRRTIRARSLIATPHLPSHSGLGLSSWHVVLGRIAQGKASPGPPVDLLVPRTVGGLAEGFLADGAGIGFFSCVDSLVGDEEEIRVEIFPAVRASVRFPLSVEPLVLQESCDGTETFPTAGTLKGFLLSVAPLVSPEG